MSPVSRYAILAANHAPPSAPAASVTIHNHIWLWPASAYGNVNRNGSGFHDGAPFVSRFQWRAWRPQTSQPNAS